jgi:arsenite-transporting ATPase
MAEAGRRVLVVSTDPAHSLGDALARRLGPRPARVPTRAGRLDAVELDADRALARWLARRRPALRLIAERGTYLDDEDLEALFRLSLPGVDELVGLVELARLSRAGHYDHVVVDTAPTGHTLRLLAMPETVQRIAGVLDHMYAKHRFLAERLGGQYRPDASDAVIAEMEREGRDLQVRLRDPRRATFDWVLLPELLAVAEAKDGVRQLDRWSMAVREVLVNRVLPPAPDGCALCAARRRGEQTAIRAIRRTFPGRALRFLPALPREPRGVPALRAFARALAAPSRGAALVRPHPADRRQRAAATPRPPAGPPAWLPVVAPPGVRLVLFAGKGGVGKTTCAAAAALALAEAAPERRVLLLSTDPAHSLGDALGTPLGDEAAPLAGAPPGLRARELDAEREFRRRRERYRTAVDELFDTVRGGSAFDAAFDRAVVQDLIELAPPGLDELVAVLSVTEALLGRDGQPPAYDTVVVDTAPTGHTVRLLALPAAGLAWVRTLLAILLKYRRVMRPGRLAEDLVALSRELRQLDRLLHDRRATRVVAVTRPGELPRRETRRLLDRLQQLGLPVAAVIVNTVPPPGLPACRRCRAAGREARAEADRAVGRGRVVLLAPMVAPPPRGVRALGHFARTWAAASAGGAPAPRRPAARRSRRPGAARGSARVVGPE